MASGFPDDGPHAGNGFAGLIVIDQRIIEVAGHKAVLWQELGANPKLLGLGLRQDLLQSAGDGTKRDDFRGSGRSWRHEGCPIRREVGVLAHSSGIASPSR